MSDGGLPRLAEAIAVYHGWLADGRPGGRDALLAAHPALADLLADLLAEAPPAAADGEAAADPSPATAGERLGDYELGAELGRGGMGVVFAARQVSLHRPVAVKVLGEAALARPRLLARFRREANLVARLDHPSIVKVIEYGSAGGRQFLAMERLPGPSLQQLLEAVRQAGGPERADWRALAGAPADGDTSRDAVATPRTGWDAFAAALTLQLAEALAHAHERGVLHRDVKPSNVLLRRGRPVLTDFGLAREPGLPSMTQTGDFAGTPHYVAPEQIHAPPGGLDGRADVFALGVVLYELLTLQRPFAAPSSAEVLHRVLHDDPVPANRLRRTVSRDLAAVVGKALEKARERRYASAVALADDLRRWLQRLPVQARTASPAQRLWRWARREPWGAALAAALLLAAALGGFLAASLPQLRAGAAALQREAVLAELHAGFGELHRALAGRALVHFAAALAAEPAEPMAHIGAVLAAHKLRRPLALPLQAARAALAAVDRTAVELLQQSLAEPTRVTAAALAELPAPASGTMAFVHAALWLELGHRREADADFRRARDCLDLAIRWGDGPSALLAQERAHATGHLADAADARATAAMLAARWPAAAWAHSWSAFAMRNVDFAAAVVAARRAVAMEPRRRVWHEELGYLLRGRGRPAEAAAAFAAASAAEPADGAVAAALASAHADAGAVDAARAAAERALAAPGLSAVAAARCLDVLGRRDEALTRLEAAFAAAPGDLEVASELGRRHRERGDLAAAEAVCRTALQQAPETPLLLDQLAWLRRQAGDFAGAHAAHRQALAIAPDAVPSRIALAQTLRAEGRNAAALAEVERAAAQRPDEFGLPLLRGTLLAALARWPEARAAFAAAVRQQPEHAEAHFNLGVACRRSGDDAAARDAYERAVALQPDDVASRVNLAAVLFDAGDLAAARGHLQHAVALAPDHPGVHANLAEVLRRLGDEAALAAELARFRDR